jgi:cell division protein FtsI (penicillin-binding protein 3)
MGVLCGAMGLALGGLVSSAFRVQVEDASAWREIAEKQRQRRLHVEPKRGTIYDRNGTPLAVSVEVPSVNADVGEMLRGIDDPKAAENTLRQASERLARVLSVDANDVYTRLQPRHRFVWIKRHITSEEAGAMRDLVDPKNHPIRGLSIEGEARRYYPGRELAGPVLGFVAPDGQGKDGLELSLDQDLRGKVEEVRGLRDRTGRLIFDGASDAHALQGDEVTLSIDVGIQHIAERELDAAMRTYETKGGSLAVVDPATGELLALASVPGYNPNDYTGSDVEARRDRSVTDRFEPGSVMKPFLMAAALQAGTLKATDSIDCGHGIYQIGATIIHDTHINDLLTPTQILARSSNIGALKIGLQLGEPLLYASYRRFGFGEPSGLPLPGEAVGVLRPKGRAWYDVETASASFGQGITVTTVQLAMAMGAIANGGKLLEPILVKRIVDPGGEGGRESGVRVRREVVSPGVARLVAEMLTAVTEAEAGGTAVEAAVPGFRVAGKTSTAQEFDRATGKYSQEKYTAVFVGFLPVERPRLVVAVVLDEPVIGRYGGDLAGPVFRRVAESSLRYLGVAPSSTSAASLAKLGTVTREGDPADTMRATMKALGRAAPPPSADVPVAAGALPPGSVRVPDASGLPAHEALTTLTRAGLVPQFEGWGRAVRQSPAAGSTAAKGSQVRIVLEPAS